GKVWFRDATFIILSVTSSSHQRCDCGEMATPPNPSDSTPQNPGYNLFTHISCDLFDCNCFS
nr:hypothetical protein [Tanacetum cinerariifolium]